jgi:hypothetical protein
LRRLSEASKNIEAEVQREIQEATQLSRLAGELDRQLADLGSIAEQAAKGAVPQYDAGKQQLTLPAPPGTPQIKVSPKGVSVGGFCIGHC